MMPRMVAAAAVVAFCALGVGAANVRADEYPSRPVRIIVGFPAGSAGDLAARTLAGRLSQTMGQQFIIENRPGASSSTAAIAAAKADKDGYTLYQTTNANVVNKILKPDLAFDLQRDFSPIALTASAPVLLVANASLGVSNVKELVELAKRKPGELNYASTGVTTTLHLAGELLNTTAGIKLVHIPYQGSPKAVTDLVAGRVQVMFVAASAVLSQIAAGAIKPLATASLKRSVILPDLPTTAEQGFPDVAAGLWFGFLAPKGTPDAVVAKLGNAANEALREPAVIEVLKQQGFDAGGGTAEEFSRFIGAETERWTTAARAAGVLAEPK
jgi:tripartite-type tricarboxylate transporter receptor subunit TctC